MIFTTGTRADTLAAASVSANRTGLPGPREHRVGPKQTPGAGQNEDIINSPPFIIKRQSDRDRNKPSQKIYIISTDH